MIATSVAAVTGATCEASAEACLDPDRHESEASYKAGEVASQGLSAVGTVWNTAWTGLDVVEDTWWDIRAASEEPCRDASGTAGAFTDLDTSEDASASADGAMSIETEAELQSSWLANCRGGIVQRDVDWYKFEVDEGEVVSATATEGGCWLLLPGHVLPDKPTGEVEGSSSCGVPQIAETSGTAYVVVWSPDRFLLGSTSPRPYVIGVSATDARMDAPADPSMSTTDVDVVRSALEGRTGQIAPGDPATGQRDPQGRRQVSGEPVARHSQQPAWTIGLALTAGLLVGLWLYRRLSADEILENDLRVRMLDVVEEKPGINASALAREIDVAVTTILYHGRVLDDAGHLTKKKVGGEIRFFTTDQGETLVEREVACALSQQGKGDLLSLLAKESGLNISEAARRLDRNRSTVKRHADDLLDRGLLQDGRDGRSRTLSLPSEVRRVVETGS